MPLASRFTAVIRLYRQKSIFNKLSLHTQRRTCTFKIFSRSCTSNGRTMDTNTLKDIATPDRFPTQRQSVSPCFFAAPMGFPVPAGGHGRQKAKSARQLKPKRLHSFAPPSSPKNKMRPAMPAPRQKAATLRQARCFGCGQQGTQHNGSAATAVYIFSGMPLPPCLAPKCALLPVPKALRPPLQLSKRMAGSRGALPQMRNSVRPLCV